MKLSYWIAAFVTPRRSGLNVAGFLPFFLDLAFSSFRRNLSTTAFGRNGVSPEFWMRTLRIMADTISSTCLSLIVTFCAR